MEACKAQNRMKRKGTKGTKARKIHTLAKSFFYSYGNFVVSKDCLNTISKILLTVSLHIFAYVNYDHKLCFNQNDNKHLFCLVVLNP